MLENVAQLYRQDYPIMTTHMQSSDDRWFTLVGFIVFIAVISAALFVVYKIASKPAASQGKDPLDIAKERYAKGEISKEEFTDIKKELSAK